ncbi:hypothetical protein Ddc_15959 [Ditylenchus destructor]|nr:hypothetical protein Ddc_15959 [Ditylenchus destructor]
MQNARQVKHTAEEVVSSFNMQCDMSVVNQRKVDLTSGVETVELLRDIFCRYREINARLQCLEEGKRSHEKWLSMKLITINPEVKTELEALESLWNGQMKKTLEDTINSLVNSKYKGEVENIQRYGVQDLSSIMRLLIDVYSNASEVGPEDLNVMETKMKNLIILAVIQHAVDGVANLTLGELKKVLRILEGFVFALIHFHDSCKINLAYEFDLIIVPMVNILQKIIEIVNKALGKVKILPETAEIEPLEISLSAIKSFLNGYTK